MSSFRPLRRALRVLPGLLGALAALSSVACDGLTSVANPEVPLWVNHPAGAMSIASRRQLSAPTRGVGESYERGKPSVDAAHLRVFVGSSDHGLYALNAGNLETLWRFETAGGVQSEPLYSLVDDSVYFGSNDGAIYKLRAADGRMLWRFASNAEVTRAPVLHRGTLFVVNANDTLIAIDPQTGKMRWYRHRPPAAGMEISGYAGPAVADGRVFAAYSDGIVMAYRLDNGAEAWPGPVDLAADAEEVAGGDELRYLDVDTTPVVGKVGDTDAIFVASYEGGVYALDARSGGRLWVNDGISGVTELLGWSAPARPVAGAASNKTHHVLIASSGLSGLWGLDPATGEELWRRDVPTGGITQAEPWMGALLVGTTRHGLFLVHPLDGGVIDGLHSGGAFAAAPSAHGRHAFALSNEGVLFGLTLTPP
ncbi:MAG: PQQ-binding-like beta-propeller repeat protein [Myxococcales bacterium]|nr:PQQ-binding-like beta-propeller repeat protein [Myxococcales bacterium]